jgi:hypothetical protein
MASVTWHKNTYTPRAFLLVVLDRADKSAE